MPYIDCRSPRVVEPTKKMIQTGFSFYLRDGTRLQNLNFKKRDQLYIGETSMSAFLETRRGQKSRWLNHIYIESGGRMILIKKLFE